MRKLVLALALVLVIFILPNHSSSGLDQAKAASAARLLPILVETPLNAESVAMGHSRNTPDRVIETVYADPNQMAELVSTVRESICAKIQKGNIRVWLKFDANGKVFGIGGSSEAGVEVNIICG